MPTPVLAGRGDTHTNIKQRNKMNYQIQKCKLNYFCAQSVPENYGSEYGSEPNNSFVWIKLQTCYLITFAGKL
jgi:hypothetical protein